jgi:hypothetical protein
MLKNMGPLLIVIVASALILRPLVVHAQNVAWAAAGLSDSQSFASPAHPMVEQMLSSENSNPVQCLKAIPKESFNPDAWIPFISKEKIAFNSQCSFNPAGKLVGFSSPLPLVLRI